MSSSAPPERRSASATETDLELLSVLRDMLDANESISVRAAVRRMKTLRHATGVTRDPWRMGQVDTSQAEQIRARETANRWENSSKKVLGVRAEIDQGKMHALQQENAILRAGLIALLRSVGEQGAIKRWRKFFDGYEAAFETLKALGVNPEAEIIPIVPGQVSKNKLRIV